MSRPAGLSSSSGNTIRSCSMRQAHIDLSVSHWAGADLDARGEAKDAANLQTGHRSLCEHYRNCVRAACGLGTGRILLRRIPVLRDTLSLAASVHATTMTPLAREPEVNSNVSTIDLLSHLDGAPFMGSFEVRYGALGFLADAIHLPVSTKITTHDVFFQGGNAALKADTGTGIALYRCARGPGAVRRCRSWLPCLGIFVEGGPQPWSASWRSVNPGGGWADPLIGGRYHRDLGNGWGLTAYGDVGGFGVGAHTDWQVLGTIDYTLNPSWNLHLGYRSLNFDITGAKAGLASTSIWGADHRRHFPFLTRLRKATNETGANDDPYAAKSLSQAPDLSPCRPCDTRRLQRDGWAGWNGIRVASCSDEARNA